MTTNFQRRMRVLSAWLSNYESNADGTLWETEEKQLSTLAAVTSAMSCPPPEGHDEHGTFADVFDFAVRVLRDLRTLADESGPNAEQSRVRDALAALGASRDD